jgi:hypothetical protein
MSSVSTAVLKFTGNVPLDYYSIINLVLLYLEAYLMNVLLCLQCIH